LIGWSKGIRRRQGRFVVNAVDLLVGIVLAVVSAASVAGVKVNIV
jgi:hypothetical protein